MPIEVLGRMECYREIDINKTTSKNEKNSNMKRLYGAYFASSKEPSKPYTYFS